MSPKEFVSLVVEPNLADQEKDHTSVRAALNAVHSVDALAAHIFCATNPPATKKSEERGDLKYRNDLAKADPDFALLRDIAKAAKHVRLDDKSLVSESSQIKSKPLGFGMGGFGEGPYGGTQHVVVTTDSGEIRSLSSVTQRAFALLLREMKDKRID